MSEITPSVLKPLVVPAVSSTEVDFVEQSRNTTEVTTESDQQSKSKIDAQQLVDVGKQVSDVVKTVAGTDLSFSVEEELSRMVVTVKAVGSDEIIRQFPPEEFLTVAKFIASRDIGEMDEEFLKGLLFNKHG